MVNITLVHHQMSTKDGENTLDILIIIITKINISKEVGTNMGNHHLNL